MQGEFLPHSIKGQIDVFQLAVLESKLLKDITIAIT